MPKIDDETTPMMRQYLEVKERYPDTLVFYRLGDFYEMFYEDAQKAARLLDLTLTSRGTNRGQPIPLCGVPFHAVDTYVARLIKMGESVVICEQEGEPSKQKTMTRKVSRIITPGTATDEGIAPEGHDNPIVCVFRGKRYWGLAALSLSSGSFKVAAAAGRAEAALYLERVNAAELVCCEEQDLEGLGADIASRKALPPWNFVLKTCYRQLTEQFKTNSLFGFDLEDLDEGIIAAGALLAYVKSTQNVPLSHLHTLSREEQSQVVLLDKVAQRNLELTTSLRGERRGSLAEHLDRTRTPMGGRLLGTLLCSPLRSNQAVEERLDIVDALCGERAERLGAQLASLGDLERISARIGLSTSRPKDLAVLREALELMPQIIKTLEGASCPPLERLTEALQLPGEILPLLRRAVAEVPSTFLRDGGVIAPGYNRELDELRDLMSGSEQTLRHIEERERQATAIPSLKVGFNSVFGYYIEVSRTHDAKIPAHYQRRQTLKNCERYITPELKELEEKALSAKSRALDLEKELFTALLDTLKGYLAELSALAAALAKLDVLRSFAEVSEAHHYARPSLSPESLVQIEEGRHPVIESITERPFVANSVNLGKTRMLVITGPNMGGKSTFMRQTALICIMARSGCFVPAKSALIGDIDRIFTRIGASDDLLSGRSTFMVEMEEAAAILNNATSRSLLLLDEVGRGTSTAEGSALAYAIAHRLCAPDCALTLFSTHYPEISELAQRSSRVQNLCFKASRVGEHITFLYEACPGTQPYSYALEVGQIAGLPRKVIEEARSRLPPEGAAAGSAPALGTLKHSDLASEGGADGNGELSDGAQARELAELRELRQLKEQLLALDLNRLSPLAALNTLDSLVGSIKGAAK